MSATAHYTITYNLPEAIRWLSARGMQYRILPYDDWTLQIFENKDRFDQFLMTKQKVANKKRQSRNDYKHKFTIKARQVNKPSNFEEIVQGIDPNNWFMLPANEGNVTFLFKHQ